MEKKKQKQKRGKNNEEIIFENEALESSSFSSKSKDKKLREKIKKLEIEKKEYLDGWQRERAEIVNLKKRHNEEKKLFTALGREAMIIEIIPVLDNFEAAFSNEEAWKKVDSAWRTGVEYIYNQFLQILENNGINQFGKIGDAFDEKLHLPIESVETSNADDKGKVFQVIQKGYRMGDKILREAKVKVYKL